MVLARNVVFFWQEGASRGKFWYCRVQYRTVQCCTALHPLPFHLPLLCSSPYAPTPISVVSAVLYNLRLRLRRLRMLWTRRHESESFAVQADAVQYYTVVVIQHSKPIEVECCAAH